MSKLNEIIPLWERVKKPGQDMGGLELLLSDYASFLKELIASDETYKKDLRRLQEEIPDLERLAGRKHEAILQGRLKDAIVAVKKKIEQHEAPAEPTGAPAQDAGVGTDITEVSLQEEPKRPFRNTPTLGMD